MHQIKKISHVDERHCHKFSKHKKAPILLTGKQTAMRQLSFNVARMKNSSIRHKFFQTERHRQIMFHVTG